MKKLSRRDFLKLGGLTLASLAFTSFLPEFTGFEDMDLVRVAKDPVSVYKEPSDKSLIVNTWPRDSLIHVYDTVQVETPGNNPHWYRVYGGYMNAARLQKVRIHYNVPLIQHPGRQAFIRGHRSVYRGVSLQPMGRLGSNLPPVLQFHPMDHRHRYRPGRQSLVRGPG